jgi:hypothetical protein
MFPSGESRSELLHPQRIYSTVSGQNKEEVSMSGDSIDYTQIINDLEAKKAAIDSTLVSLRAAMALGAVVGQPGDSSSPSLNTIMPSASGGEVPVGAFLGKSIPEAAKLCLQIVKKKLTSKEIAEALKKGGIESTAKSFPMLVHSILDRASKSGSGIVKLDRSYWGLIEWYPSAMRAAGASEKRSEKKSAKRKKSQARTKKPESKPTENKSVEKKEGESSYQKVAAALKNKPGTELSKQEIALSTGVAETVVGMLLGTLVKTKKAEKTASGKFRAMAA